MPILEKDDVVLDYLETGQGTTVILIHSTVVETASGKP